MVLLGRMKGRAITGQVQEYFWDIFRTRWFKRCQWRWWYVCAACGVHSVVDQMKDGFALSQMKDGTIFGTKEAHVRATTLCVRQSLEPFLSFRPLPNF